MHVCSAESPESLLAVQSLPELTRYLQRCPFWFHLTQITTIPLFWFSIIKCLSLIQPWSYTKAICPRIIHIRFLFFTLINPRSLIHFSYFISGFQYWPHRKIIWELFLKNQCLGNSQENLNQDLWRLNPGTDIFKSSPGNSRCAPKLEDHCTYFQFLLCWLLYS